jgi:hypothetical protein
VWDWEFFLHAIAILLDVFKRQKCEISQFHSFNYSQSTGSVPSNPIRLCDFYFQNMTSPFWIVKCSNTLFHEFKKASKSRNKSFDLNSWQWSEYIFEHL